MWIFQLGDKVFDWGPWTRQSWELIPSHAPGGVALQGSCGGSRPAGLFWGLGRQGQSPSTIRVLVFSSIREKLLFLEELCHSLGAPGSGD